MKVLVLGPTGMLGHEMVRTLKANHIEVKTAGRSGSDVYLDAYDAGFPNSMLQGFDYIVNCIGLTTHNINLDDQSSVAAARVINSEFPRKLIEFAEGDGAKVIQIATDCVFSGAAGRYVESDAHDAIDTYGTTKSEGEVPSTNSMHLRSSIIGRELRGKKSLLEWVLNQPRQARIPGFTDRMWNGVTTTAFSKVVAGIVSSGDFKSGVWHLVPKDFLSKFDLVSLIAKHFGRSDLDIVPSESGNPKDLTLSTLHPELNHSLWVGGDYGLPPTIEKLIVEMAH